MTCRDDKWTRENRNWRKGRNLLRLREIAVQWPRYLEQTQRNMFLRQCMRTKQRFCRWRRRQCAPLKKVIDELLSKYHKDRTSVSPEDWDAAVYGKIWKVEWLLRNWKHVPVTRAKWPAEVPSFLNVIAYEEHKRDKAHKGAKKRADDRSKQQADYWAKKRADLAEVEDERRRSHERSNERVMQQYTAMREEMRKAHEQRTQRLKVASEWRDVARKSINAQTRLISLLIELEQFFEWRRDPEECRGKRVEAAAQWSIARALEQELNAKPRPHSLLWGPLDAQMVETISRQVDRVRIYNNLLRLCHHSRLDPFSVRVQEWEDAVEGTDAAMVYPGARMRMEFSEHWQLMLGTDPDTSREEIIRIWDALVTLQDQEEWTWSHLQM